MISFIIPAYNEESNIGNTIASIRQQCGNSTPLFEFEIIVIDNGSTDQTRVIADSSGAKTSVLIDTTIAGLRNFGARQAAGEIFIFLDADVLLTENWSKNIYAVTEDILREPTQITGSHASPPQDTGNWFHKHWFMAFCQEPESEHLGSAHMIIARSFFEELGGFNSSLVTAEDFDICQRARAAGGKIHNRVELEVIHPDYPDTVSDFVSREIWHRKGDCIDLKTALASRSLVAGVVFYLLIMFSLSSFIAGWNAFGVLLLAVSVLLLLTVSFYKFRHFGTVSVLINAVIFIPYFLGRVLAIFLKQSR